MPDFELKIVSDAPVEDVIELYKDAGWWEEGWSRDAAKTMISGSFRFAGLFRDGQLVGMGRALSDGVSDAYIQDVVIRSDLREQGWGLHLVPLLITELKSAGIDWIGLIGVPGSENFYRKLGFSVMKDFVPMKLQC